MTNALVPLADVIAPNLWELARIAGGSATDAPSAVALARKLGRPCLATSVPAGEGRIGVLLVDGGEAIFAVHRKLESVPRGTGDLLTALFAAGLIEELSPREALARAVGGVASAVEATEASRATELPIAALADRLMRPAAKVSIETLA